jgi:hypothetical protein
MSVLVLYHVQESIDVIFMYKNCIILFKKKKLHYSESILLNALFLFYVYGKCIQDQGGNMDVF